MRRAYRVTALTFGGLAVVAVVVALIAGQTGVAIVFAVFFAISLLLGFWLTPRILNRQ